MKHSIKLILLLAALLADIKLFASDVTLKLRIIETTDIHSNIMDFDYYKNKPVENIGLARTATLVRKARAEVLNSVLVDNGDLIQGSPMGDYIASRGLNSNQTHPVYQAMNTLNYDVGNIGNHEFNYGLDFLKNALRGANFSTVNANVMKADGEQNYFTPYLIKSYSFTDNSGQTQTLKIGYIGFVPPQILLWDKINLEGKVQVEDIKKSAEKWVPKMKAEGADIVIAIPHSGISTEPYRLMAENSVYYLSEVDNIDAIAFGHSHTVFPGKNFANLANINIEKGTINEVAAVMPGKWGSHVGIIDLELVLERNSWHVKSSQSEARPIYDEVTKQPLVTSDPDVLSAVEKAHHATNKFAQQPIGKSTVAMYSYLALIQDDPTVQMINLAQADYVKTLLQGDPDYEGIPILSASAPFKTGGRKNNAANFTEVEAGELTFRNAADLYPYPNTLVVLSINGSEVKEWLECSAGLFKQVDPSILKPQPLINWSGFRAYNFDVIDGVEYQIDISQAAKYDGNCQLINKQSERIKNLRFNGKPIDPQQRFLIATNNYRAYTGRFSGTGSDHVLIQSPDENRSITANYIRKQTKIHGEVTPTIDNNWTFYYFESENQSNVTLSFETSPDEKATNFIADKSIYPMKKIAIDADGFAVYQFKLAKIINVK